MRDSEVEAESQGIDVAATELCVYVAAAFGSGVAGGALYFLMNLRISPDAAFGVSWSAFVIFIVVIGGIGTIEGPILGTLLFFALRRAPRRLRHLVPDRARPRRRARHARVPSTDLGLGGRALRLPLLSGAAPRSPVRPAIVPARRRKPISGDARRGPLR